MKIFGKYKVSGQTEEFRKEEKNLEAFCAQNKLKNSCLYKFSFKLAKSLEGSWISEEQAQWMNFRISDGRVERRAMQKCRPW